MADARVSEGRQQILAVQRRTSVLTPRRAVQVMAWRGAAGETEISAEGTSDPA
jgi:hypothetical protein